MSELLAFLISELRDDLPEVPLPPEVDLAELTAGDEHPMFVTLPLLEVGAKSDKGFTWTEPDVDRVVSEINTKRPEGNFGHVKPEDRSHAYSPGKVRWLGATRIGKVAVGKCYVPPYAADARDYFRVAKATRARVGTSVYGVRGRQGLRDMNLETVDFGHPDRLGSGMAVVPKLTSELGGYKMGEHDQDQDTLIAELRNDRATFNLVVSELKLDPKEPLQGAKALVSEIADLRQQKTTLDSVVAELKLGDNPVATAKVIAAQLVEHARATMVTDVDGLIAEMIKDNEPLRPFIRDYLVETDAQGRERVVMESLDAAKARIGTLLKSEHIVELAKTLVSETRGPNAFVRGKQRNGDANQPDVSDDAVAKARAETGI